MSLTVGAGSSNIYYDKTNTNKEDSDSSDFKTILKICSPGVALMTGLFDKEA